MDCFDLLTDDSPTNSAKRASVAHWLPALERLKARPSATGRMRASATLLDSSGIAPRDLLASGHEETFDTHF